VHDSPVPLSERVAGLPKKLESVILRCLAKDPEQRFADAPELLRALAECDDVPDWSQLDALTWWQTRRRPLADDGASSPSRKTLAIDFGERLASTTE
jgi:eukaryotic-like serine/threonine-protein kinase